MEVVDEITQMLKDRFKEIDAICSECGKEHTTYETLENREHLCEECRDAKHRKEAKETAINKFNIQKDYIIQGRTGLGVPKRYVECSLGNFIGNVSELVETWINKGSDNLLLQSPKAGNGKTHLAIACLKQMLISNIDKMIEKEDGSGARYVDFKEVRYDNGYFKDFVSIMGEIKASFDDKSTSERDVIRKYVAFDVLVIDDIGAEKPSDYTQAVIYEIINTRYNDMKPTIVTTNLSSKDMTEIYGSRMLSRIASGVIIQLSGNDMRLK
jgi:DNA replication protein DnaC